MSKKIYFSSDQHFGIPSLEESHKRERKFVEWLEMAEKDAEHIFLLGDFFDFWFEYKSVVPRGFTRVLGKLAQITDKGIPISFFVGNHDLWMNDYFEKEIGIKIYRKTQIFEFYGKKFFLGHGDGLGPKDIKFKLMKKVFINPLAKWLFARVHPNFAISIANYFSHRSKLANGDEYKVFMGKEKEWLVAYAERKLEALDIDYFLFGHRHLAMDIKLSSGARYINTGEWVTKTNYAVFEEGELFLKEF